MKDTNDDTMEQKHKYDSANDYVYDDVFDLCRKDHYEADDTRYQ